MTYDRRYEPPREVFADSSTQLLVGHTRGLLLPRQECQQPNAWWCGEARLVGDIAFRCGWALAVNPEQRLVGTVVRSYIARDVGLVDRRTCSTYPFLCIVCELDACRLSEHGVLTPVAQRLLEYQQERDRAVSQAARTHGPSVPVPRRRPSRRMDRHAEYPRREVQEAEYLRRAEGLATEQRLALIKEMFLPRERS